MEIGRGDRPRSTTDAPLAFPPDLPPILVDRRALWEVLSNIMDNALKYTPSGGAIFVQILRQVASIPPYQGVVIADTGPGIPMQDRSHLFERHYRGVQANTSIPGTGLGLAIARDLVYQMQGEIHVFSPAATSERLDVSIREQIVATGNPGTAIVLWFEESD
ncbi:MAG: ATP-binding protein [Leptolyngbyaceae cyanobacterium SL_7_1]|nr:ATP-binding protein [Leptolyngbyaceae cyanobacterium SL_7_1]